MVLSAPALVLLIAIAVWVFMYLPASIERCRQDVPHRQPAGRRCDAAEPPRPLRCRRKGAIRSAADRTRAQTRAGNAGHDSSSCRSNSTKRCTCEIGRAEAFDAAQANRKRRRRAVHQAAVRRGDGELRRRHRRARSAAQLKATPRFNDALDDAPLRRSTGATQPLQKPRM